MPLHRSPRLVLCALLSLATVGTAARADIIAGDSYVVGTNPLAGQYSASPNASLMTGQATTLHNAGFADGGYTHGTGTNNFVASATGLNSAVLGESSATSGSVGWIGAPDDGQMRSVARNLSGTAPSVGTYWFSAVVQATTLATPGAGTAANPLGYALAGYGNATFPTTGTTSGYLQGLYFGLAHESTDAASNNGDLVIRYRTLDTGGARSSSDAVLLSNAAIGSTYTIIARLDVNSGGVSNANDTLTYWVNPTNISSQAGMDATSLTNNDGNSNGGPIATYAFQSAADFARLNFASQDWNGNASFDGLKLATNLSDFSPAVTVPEPGSAVMAGLGLAVGLGLAIRRRARA